MLATNATRYVEGLTAYRTEQVVEWCLFFTRALRSATEHAKHLNEQLRALQAHWREVMKQPRSHSAIEKLIQHLPAQPVIDMRLAATLTGSSEEAARRALNDLETAGILSTVQIGKKRNRIWEARALLALMDSFEWTIAQPTRSGEPARPSPPKPDR
ncbi:hypothetical protein D3C72_1931310 [compost metagenome]